MPDPSLANPGGSVLARGEAALFLFRLSDDDDEEEGELASASNGGPPRLDELEELPPSVLLGATLARLKELATARRRLDPPAASASCFRSKRRFHE